MLSGSATFAVMAALLLTSNAATVNLYSKPGCNPADLLNDWHIADNTCSTGMPHFQSFLTTHQGEGVGGAQRLRPFYIDACAGNNAVCVAANQLNVCHNVDDGNGSVSKAMNSEHKAC